MHFPLLIVKGCIAESVTVIKRVIAIDSYNEAQLGCAGIFVSHGLSLKGRVSFCNGSGC